MIELPESATLAKQLSEQVTGRAICSVTAGASPHKFCWFHGDETQYDAILKGAVIDGCSHYGGWVELSLGDLRLNFHDGVNMQLFAPGAKLPPKHQLFIELDDGSTLIGRVQMYGGISLFRNGELDNPYYLVSRQKPNPYTNAFNRAYFQQLLDEADESKLSAKAFLATEQRIPGVGNGVLQDILWKAKIHPKTKLRFLNEYELDTMYSTMKELLKTMADAGGRDTEKDLFGNPGGYKTVMSKNNNQAICPVCGGPIKREAYMGGNVYVCSGCQVWKKQ